MNKCSKDLLETTNKPLSETIQIDPIVANQVSNQVPDQVPDQVPSLVAKESNEMSNRVSNGMSNGVSNRVSNWVSNGMSNRVSNGVSNGVSNNISNGVSNGVSNRLSNQVPNQETRQTEVQLNIVTDGEIVTSELPCAPTNEQCCGPRVWVFNDIEKTIQARKCPIPRQILLWIVHLICILIFSAVVVFMFGDVLYMIGLLMLYIEAEFGYIAGIINLVLTLIGIAFLGWFIYNKASSITRSNDCWHFLTYLPTTYV